MSRRTALSAAVPGLGVDADRDAETDAGAADVDASASVDPPTVAGALACLGAVPAAATRLLVNAPVAVPGATDPAWRAFAETTALAAPAAGALTLGLALADRDRRRLVGLVAAGVFGLLAAFSPAAALPAAGAVVVGGWLAVADALAPARVRAAPAPTAVVAALLGGATLSLAGAMGVAPATLRPAGTLLALAGVALSPAAVRTPRTALAGGGAAALGTAYAGLAAPFPTGAVVLVVAGAIRAPLALVALAVGGGVATALTGVVRRRPARALAGVLLLAAGVPGSVARALAVTVAATLLAVEATRDEPTTNTDGHDDHATDQTHA